MECKSLPAAIIVGALCFVGFYPITFYFIKNICCMTGCSCKCDCSPQCKLKGFSIAIFFLFFISIHGFGLAGVLHCAGFKKSIYNRFQTLGSTYFVGQLFTLIIFILRLDYSFDGSLTTFKYPKKYIYGLYFAVFITLSLIFGLIWYRTFTTYGTPNITILLTIGFTFVFCYLATYIAVNIMFWKKIWTVLTHLKQLRLEEMSSRENDNRPADIMVDIVNVGGRIKLLVRYAVAIGVSFVSTILMYVTLIIWVLTGWESSNVTDISDILMGLDALINSFCIILLFGFSESIYNTMCKKCDHWIKNKLIDKVNREKQSTAETTCDVIANTGDKVEKTRVELVTLLQ